MGIPVATVTSDGQPLDPTIELLEVEIDRELNRIPEARLVLLDGSMAKQKFEVSDSALFVPGKRVAIALRYAVLGTNSRFNMVFPFYLNEATAVGL